MRVLIIEDEKLSADHLESLIHRFDAAIEIIAHLDSIKKSIQLLETRTKIDLIFLDIHLADGLSFEIFNHLEVNIPIIFTTAFSEYAVKAFEQNSIDYLLKPINYEELSRSLNKFNSLQEKWSLQSLEKILPLLQETQNNYKTKFLVKRGESLQVIQTDSIHHFIAEDGIVLLVNSESRRFPIDFTLDQLEKEINPSMFFRINRKVLIQKSKIEKLSIYFNSRLKIQTPHLDSDSSIVSRERVVEFKKWLEE